MTNEEKVLAWGEWFNTEKGRYPTEIELLGKMLAMVLEDLKIVKRNQEYIDKKLNVIQLNMQKQTL